MMLRTNENGRSMVEMMGYMAVMMTVIVAIGKIVTNVFNEHKYSQASIQLSDLATAISKAGAMEKDYSQVNMANYIPSTYKVAGDKIFHAFGGEVSVGSVSGDPDKFSITFRNLKRKQCIELAMKDWRHNRNVDLYSIGVNNTYLYWPVYKSGVGLNDSLPMTRIMLTGKTANEKGLCNLDVNNTVTWIFN